MTFEIPERSIVSIIGPNGAGKTTFFNMLTGLYKPSYGSISFAGRNITGRRPDRIMKDGMARTFQNIRLFGTMSALENVMVGQHARMGAGLFGSILRVPRVGREERAVMDKAHEVLSYVGISEDHHDTLSVSLSYGEQRRLEIARALASDPKLLLLDEPTAGMNPQESAELTDFMHKVRDERGLTILLIEHDMQVVMGVSERITVLDHGLKIAEGSPEAGAREPTRDRGLSRQAGGCRGGGRRGKARTGRGVRAGRPVRAGGRDLMALLEVTDMHTYYGNIEALKGISVTVEEGEVVTLIGSNGAGKSTTLRSISGLTPPRQGTIKFDGQEIGEVPPQEIVQMGISQSPEGRHVFPRMTVRENLELGAYLRKDKDGIGSDLDRVFELFPRLKEREKQKGGTMSGGEQQMLAIGRALMANPKLLLLDEPSMGIAPILVERIYETIAEINRQGTTILLVEQNANYALDVSQRGYVLETGKIALEDKSSELRTNPEVQKAYLGA